jgi:hypothetical protein
MREMKNIVLWSMAGWLLISFSALGEKTRPAVIVTRAGTMSFKGWKEVYKLSTGRVEALIVPAVGRLVSFRLVDGQNVFMINEKMAGFLPLPQQSTYASLGGLYSWIAPESHWVTPKKQKYGFIDSKIDFGPYTVTSSSNHELTMISPVSETYGLRMEKKFILVKDQTRLEYTVTLHNVGSTPVRWSVWNLTGVAPKGIAFFETPGGQSDFGFFYGRNSEYHQSQYAKVLRVIRGNLGVADFRQYTASGAKAYVRVGSPYLAYRQAGSWLVRSFEADPFALFTDQQSQIEFWADAKQNCYLELEVLSPEYLIKPGQKVSWQETMDLFADAEPVKPDPEEEAQKLSGIMKRIQLKQAH